MIKKIKRKNYYLKELKPVTPGMRGSKYDVTKKLNKKVLVKSLVKGVKNSSGRNNQGKITRRHRGGGHKRRFRKIDFHENLTNSVNIVTSIEYDPFRNSNIASIFDISEKSFKYVTAPKHLSVGNIVKTGFYAEAKIGHTMPLYNIPLGCDIYNIALKPNSISKISRSAGTFSRIIKKTNKYAIIKMRSKRLKIIPIKAVASIGVVSNELSNMTCIGKAGKNRWLNKRPKVRGVAMNPVDHPHGGGEGKTSGGRSSVTPWGKPTKGYPTRKKEKKDVKINK